MNTEKLTWLNQKLDEEGLPPINLQNMNNEEIKQLEQRCDQEIELFQQFSNLQIQRPSTLATQSLQQRLKAMRTPTSQTKSLWHGFGAGFICCAVLAFSAFQFNLAPTIYQSNSVDLAATSSPENGIKLVSMSQVFDKISGIIDLDFESNQSTQIAHMSVVIPENMQIDNHLLENEIQWPVIIVPGINQLSIPINFIEKIATGDIDILISTQDTDFSFTITVDPFLS